MGCSLQACFIRIINMVSFNSLVIDHLNVKQAIRTLFRLLQISKNRIYFKSKEKQRRQDDDVVKIWRNTAPQLLNSNPHFCTIFEIYIQF